MFPADVRKRAAEILDNMKGGTGAYSESKGVKFLREMVAAGIEERDGHPCDIEDLWLTDGASVGCHYLMKTLIRDENDAVLVPIPQYPLYSATLALYGGTLLPYYLQEEKGWALDVAELKSQTDKARSEGKTVRALVIINPGRAASVIHSFTPHSSHSRSHRRRRKPPLAHARIDYSYRRTNERTNE